MRGNGRPHLSEAHPSELLTRRLGGRVAEGGPVARQLPLYDRIAFLSADERVLGWLSYAGPGRWTEQIPERPIALLAWMQRERPAVPLAMYPEISLWARAASVILRARQLREQARSLQRSSTGARRDLAANLAAAELLLRPWYRPTLFERFTSRRAGHAHDRTARTVFVPPRSRAKAER